jgi:prepilin-type N-terminal cleavage/methylation domain-containing protein
MHTHLSLQDVRKAKIMLDKVLKIKKGFTLIELMIVVVIIGILAAMAIPVFMQATSKSKQSEAKAILKQIYVMEEAYRQENNTYACDGEEVLAGENFGTIGVEIMSSARYTYSITADSNSFTATATGNIDDDETVDTWEIDQTGNLACTSNDATS